MPSLPGHVLSEWSYEPFSRDAVYVEVNKRFVESLGLERRTRILDLACGTGTLTELLQGELVRAPQRPSSTRLFGVDVSAEPIFLARDYLGAVGGPGRPAVAFAQASSERLPFADGSLDAVVMGNAIQLLEDKDHVAREVDRVLEVGGLFAFNTSFYAGSYLPGTEAFYLRWVEEAVRYIAGLDGNRRVRRRRGAAAPAFSNRWLSPEEYADLLRRNGFQVRETHVRTVMLSQGSFETIGAYAGLATVLLSGYPAALACEALQHAAGPALVASGMEEVPRGWLEVSADKARHRA